MASRHVSLRLDPELIERLDERGRRSGQTRTQLAKTLLEEGLRMEAHPGIIFRTGPAGRRPGLVGGPDIWEIARQFRPSDAARTPDLAAIASELNLSTEQIRIALSYYANYRAEVDGWIDQVDREADELRAAFERERALLNG